MTEPAKRCGAKTRQGTPCTKVPGYGTDHVGYGRCKHHGGASPAGIRSAQRQHAEQAVATYGLPREVDPHAALLEELHRTAGHVAWLGLQVAALDEHNVYGPVGGGPDSIPRQEPHVYIGLYQAERKHLAQVAKTCVDVGIAERQIRAIEAMGAEIADFGRRLAVRLGHDPADPAVREAFRAELTVIQGGRAA